MNFALSSRFPRWFLTTGIAVSTLALSHERLHAQTRIVLNPQTSSANPDLVAYELLVGDKQELTVYRVSDKKTFPALLTKLAPGPIQMRALASDRSVVSFSGDMDWCPILFTEGTVKNWFAYVATDRGAAQLYLHYIGADGNVGKEPPLQLQIVGGARQPRWSRDGKQLAFISDNGELQVFWNVDQVLLKRRSAAALRATPATAAGTAVLNPSWSPRSNYIAYQTLRDAGGSRRSQIEVIGVDTTARTFRGTPVVVSSDVSDANAYRPSWSPDAKYLAMYTDRDGRGPAGPLDIAVLELKMEASTGRVTGGALQHGQSNRIASAVRANIARGPSWSRATSGGIPQPALVYAQDDGGKTAPIYLHLLESWLSSQGLDAERVEVSAGFTSTAHSEVATAESRGFVRYTYVTEEKGIAAVSTYDDRLAKWAIGPLPEIPRSPDAGPFVRTAVNRPSSLPLAFVFPGAGQLAGSHKTKGALLSAVGVVGAGLFLKGTSGRSSAASESEVSFASKDLSANRAAVDRFNRAKSSQMLGAGTLGAAWIIGVIDAAVQKKSRSRTSAVGSFNSSSPSGRRTFNAGIVVPFGRGSN